MFGSFRPRPFQKKSFTLIGEEEGVESHQDEIQQEQKKGLKQRNGYLKGPWVPGGLLKEEDGELKDQKVEG